MRLGAALSQRAKLAQKLNDLKGRIKTNCLVQDGTTPAENPYDLMAEYQRTSVMFQRVVQKIAEANASTMVGDRTLLAVLQDRESLIRIRNLYGMAADAATPGTDRYRYMRSELSFVATVDVADLRRQEDELSLEVAALDMQIQQVNWETEIPDNLP